MIKEINFAAAIKLGKTLELSWHDVRGQRWEVTHVGQEFHFRDTKGEFPTTKTTVANVKFWVEYPSTQVTDEETPKKRATK